ncbi:hypothetical protein [Caenimonas koreensis]|uniref:Uncharacterized protein n=1 Tax=Caenimonas koreensis DSM 17982 TaxID=1121255 RepID=A0A844AUP9_9BURK|nr:hypothetical protein [Caenimonas koreensis]MRD46108.1 hypothetical protein [Caenimonas koreensis DSM 17982]
MTTPQSEIDVLRREFLESTDADLFKFDLAFGVARNIVEYEDPDLLGQFPSWVGDMVHDICDSYRQHSHYGIISNLGEADHSEMVGKLVKLLDGRA